MNARMKLCLTTALIALLMAKNGDAFARSQAAALVDEQHCMFCHTSGAPHLAPSFPQIAQHYSQVPHASAALEQKLSVEGPAHWGDITMPIADRVDPLSPAEARTVAQWVLNQ
jgi:cytochrome c551/c552